MSSDLNSFVDKPEAYRLLTALALGSLINSFKLLEFRGFVTILSYFEVGDFGLKIPFVSSSVSVSRVSIPASSYFDVAFLRRFGAFLSSRAFNYQLLSI